MSYHIYVSGIRESILGKSRVKDFSPELNEVFEQEKADHTEGKEDSEYDSLGVIDAQISSGLDPALAFQLLKLRDEFIGKGLSGYAGELID